MKAVILAGGFGTRLSEVTNLLPKPMVEIGGKPILWHIMKTYSHYGINDFIICCGYKQYIIKEYFANYFCHNCDMTVNLSDNSTEILDNHSENWRVTMIDTGLHTMTGSRIKRIQKYIGNERFLLTYGDGVSDINIADVIVQHENNGAILTLTAYMPTGKFGALDIDKTSNRVRSFQEKPKGDGNWINAGYFVCEPEVFEYIPDDQDFISFEKEPLEQIAKKGGMFAYKHTGFWRPMDVLKDNRDLNELWDKGEAPWKVW
ncbi:MULTISPECIES: glucose-1-phosphate cytidylyltransferase [Butyricimonas]|uniref:glucose-1-phosphate cytidylyltransferase n=1 Tax=Butyricimonas TaxID=574697 RepID=UPI00208244FB|nr:glucose-1-phosphate cytidylyltransferase [Butyricimonas paravirosa]BDF53086.1 glucose-1-phosphate cytidylyltransferase [Odoribacteraceae bacterium]GKH92025.1 glucose-1-phosphate cytidylyltransferase [Odoribacteraceae bacterium]GKH96643.1 glucose-1-phosphate cytidylyltransferase [Odoribacteraceae bacterium]GKI03522.1 glucose-1-phosphate cytidylyltransferase [Odoribacteraceae bacterium]